MLLSIGPGGVYTLAMPRTARASAGGVCYHVTNRGNGRAKVFHDADDYAAFLTLLRQAGERLPMRLVAYCLMPNHFHLVAWPRADGDLSRWMQWLLTSHVRRHHGRYRSRGHIWQGRFKAFPIQSDDHLLTVIRYVERNPVRAVKLKVRSAERWRWSSIAANPPDDQPALSAGPVPRGRGWLQRVNQDLTAAELEAVRHSIARGQPFGSPRWQAQTAVRLGLESSLRPRGRPPKREEI